MTSLPDAFYSLSLRQASLHSFLQYCVGTAFGEVPSAVSSGK
jgi:hypothetical protein